MTLKRACSLLTVKSFSEDERVITGIASTPSPDRDGDILEPEGAEFGSAIPFLWQHDHSRPVGQCTVRRVSEGLEIGAGSLPFDRLPDCFGQTGMIVLEVDPAPGESHVENGAQPRSLQYLHDIYSNRTPPQCAGTEMAGARSH